MNKYYLIVCVILWFGGTLFGNDSTVDFPEGGILPEMCRYALPREWCDPFQQKSQEASNEIERVNVDLLSQYLRLKISGYLESNESTKSCCLWEDSKTLRIGDTIALKGAPGVENGAIDLTLSSIRSPFVIFKYGDEDLSLNMDRRLYGAAGTQTQPFYVIENVVAKGVIIHPDGWVVATNAQLKLEDNLWVYIQDIPYPVKFIAGSNVCNLSLLKIFNSHHEIKLPYIPIAEKNLEVGNAIFTQEFFDQKAPYKRQVLIKKDNVTTAFEPEVGQQPGAIRLSEDFKLVGFYSERAVTQEELQLFLGPLANVEDEVVSPYPLRALINIIQDED